MLSSSIEVRVRYSETDRMGFVYYGNYATYFEIGRVEALRNLGISYKDMEDGGISLPVVEYRIKYIKPAFYDDLLTVVTRIKALPTAKIEFEYETFNSSGELLNKAETILVFVNIKTMKPCMAPSFVLEKLKTFFEN